jgi:microcystin-dependent protein
MATPFLGEIKMFGGNFAPVGFAFCSGQLLAISQNDALFALIGTIYGGDGQTTFGLPDLRGRLPVHLGTLSGGGNYVIGQSGGSEQVTLTTPQLPTHNHSAQASSAAGTQNGPGNGVWAQSSLNQFGTGNAASTMTAQNIQNSGGSQSHDNMMPFLAVNFIIALEGVFPSQN